MYIENDRRRLEYTVFIPNDLPINKKPTKSSAMFIIRTYVPAEMFGDIAPSITDIPLTPPVEKLFGNLKKYTPIATRSVPNVMVKNSFILFAILIFHNLSVPVFSHYRDV